MLKHSVFIYTAIPATPPCFHDLMPEISRISFSSIWLAILFHTFAFIAFTRRFFDDGAQFLAVAIFNALYACCHFRQMSFDVMPRLSGLPSYRPPCRALQFCIDIIIVQLSLYFFTLQPVPLLSSPDSRERRGFDWHDCSF